MTPAEAAALLTVAAAYDNRKPDADQARAWAMVLDGLRFTDCRDAIVAHYRTSREWMMPADVFAGVKRIRHQRVREFGALPEPPREIDPDDTAALQQWEIDTTRRIADGELTTDNPKPLPAGPWGDRPTPLEAAAEARATQKRIAEICSQLARRAPEPERPTLADLAAQAAPDQPPRTVPGDDSEAAAAAGGGQ